MAFACSRIAAAGLGLLLAGCTVTSGVGDDLTTASLAQERKGAALLMAGVEGEACATVYTIIGVREKDAFRHRRGLMIRRVEKISVAEVKLDPGEYHIVGFNCANRGHTAKLGEADSDGGLFPVYKKSYATFTVQPGEIVNIGFLRVTYLGETPGAFTSTINVKLGVSEWPSAEVERFKQRRTNLYAQMKTRLMRVIPHEPVSRQQIEAKCSEMRKLQTEGKIQNLPPGCAPPSRRPRASGIANGDLPT